MKLDLSSLRKAIDSLERTLKVAENKSLAAELDNDVKDARYLLDKLQELND